MDIEDLVEALRKDRLRVTDHADEEAQSENITFDEIFNSVLQGEIIENYPKDKPYPNGVF